MSNGFPLVVWSRFPRSTVCYKGIASQAITVRAGRLKGIKRLEIDSGRPPQAFLRLEVQPSHVSIHEDWQSVFTFKVPVTLFMFTFMLRKPRTEWRSLRYSRCTQPL